MFPNAERGLPYPVFRLVAYLVPMVNIELAIVNYSGEILLSYRKSSTDIPKSGWHLPGGIVRVGERLNQRVKRTAEIEVGFEVSGERIIAVSETLISKKISRRHFVSFLVVCKPKFNLAQIRSQNQKELLSWFAADKIPKNLIANHERYRDMLMRLCKAGPTQFEQVMIVNQDEAFTRIVNNQ